MPAVAADMAVPFPFSNPVIVVEIVIAGVVPPLEDPAKPFADTTDNPVSVPVAAATQVGARVVPLL